MGSNAPSDILVPRPSKGKPSRGQKPLAACLTSPSGAAGKGRKQSIQLRRINRGMCLTTLRSQGMLIRRPKAAQSLGSIAVCRASTVEVGRWECHVLRRKIARGAPRPGKSRIGVQSSLAQPPHWWSLAFSPSSCIRRRLRPLPQAERPLRQRRQRLKSKPRRRRPPFQVRPWRRSPPRCQA